MPGRSAASTPTMTAYVEVASPRVRRNPRADPSAPPWQLENAHAPSTMGITSLAKETLGDCGSVPEGAGSGAHAGGIDVDPEQDVIAAPSARTRSAQHARPL